MSSGRNKKEKIYAQKTPNKACNFFGASWSKHQHLLTFTMTKKNTNNIIREQLVGISEQLVFYMKTKNKISINNNSTELRQTWSMRRWNCINQTYNSKNNFASRLTKNWSRWQEGMSSFNIFMFSFSNIVLLRSTRT